MSLFALAEIADWKCTL